MIDANAPITVTLPAGHYNVLLQGLGEMPYRIAAPVIAELQKALQAAAPDAYIPGPLGPTPPRPNGHDARE